MLVSNILNKINNLNEYHSISQNYESKFLDPEIELNMDIILSLNKIKSLEIEYFNKYESYGIALILFKRLLGKPPSLKWSSLGKDLVSLLRYWLYALRKNLIIHNQHWWMFLKQLLIFVKDLRLKHRGLPNILVEETGCSLLDLTVCEQLNMMQRFTVLHCFNICSAESSKECRLRLTDKLDHYFVKLSDKLPTCGHFPTQLCILETLLRWLVNRQDVEARRAAAKKWFKNADEYVRTFLKRPWLNFNQDSRYFLNVMNEGSELVTSVPCNSLTVGDINLFTDRAGWLDVGIAGRCLTAVVLPEALRPLGLQGHSYEVLVIPEQDTVLVYMQKESAGLTITVKMSSSPHLAPSGAELAGRDVTAVVGDANLARLDKALTTVFAGKYRLADDSVLRHAVEQSRAGEKGTDKQVLLKAPCPPVASTSAAAQLASDSETRYTSQQLRAGEKGTRLKLLKSLSTTSTTTSLGQLHDKLAAIPPYHFDKVLTKVCLRPDLSNVLETSEPEQCSFNTSINLFKPRPVNDNGPHSETIASHSNEDLSTINKKCLSPGNSDNERSLLLSATLGPANAFVVNENIRLPKEVDYAKDNIVDMVIQEALKEYPNNNVSDKDVSENIADTNVEVIEGTQFLELKRGEKTLKQQSQRRSTKISLLNKESETEIDDTPKCYVNLRKRNIRHKNVTVRADINIDKYNNNSTQIDMSRQLTKKDNINSLITPLPKNINTFQDSYDSFDKALALIDNSDVMECLDSMLNKVCSDFDKCSEYHTRDHAVSVHRDPSNIIVEKQNVVENSTTEKQNQAPKHRDAIKLTYKVESVKQNINQSRKISKNLNRDQVIGVHIGSSKIIGEEQNVVENNKREEQNQSLTHTKEIEHTYKIGSTKKNKTSEKADVKIPSKNDTSLNEISECMAVNLENSTEKRFLRKKRNLNSPKLDQSMISKNIPVNSEINARKRSKREKRKLYSPKDDQSIMQNSAYVPETEEGDIPLNELKLSYKTPKTSKAKTDKSKATCYKNKEKKRQRILQPRLTSKETPSLSPRTSRKHQLFDSIKNSEDTGEKVILVPVKSSGVNLTVYNFSDSDDSNFVKKFTSVKKRASITTVDDNTISTKRRRVINKIDYDETVDNLVDEPVKVTKKLIKHKNSNVKGKKKNTSKTHLIDERIRKAPTDVMNNSLTLEVNTEQIFKEPEFTLQSKPQMEILEESIHNESVCIKPMKPIKNKRLSVRKRVPNVKVSDKRTDDEMSERSNPSFLIENEQYHRNDLNESVLNIQVNTLEKLRKGNQEATLNDNNINTTYPGFAIDEDNAVCNLIQEHNVIEDAQCLEVIDVSEKSIQTMGNSPINAHGDFDEAPPCPDLINRNIQARDLDTEHLRPSLKDYVNVFRRNDSEVSVHEESNTYIAKKKHANSVKSNSKTLVVSVCKLSSSEIRKWMAKTRSSEWDSEEENVEPKSTKELVRTGVQKSVSGNSRSCKSSHSVIPKCQPLRTSQQNEIRKSMISPIKLFEEVFPHKTNIIQSSSDDEDGMQEIKEYQHTVKPTNDKASSSNKRFIRNSKVNESKSNRSKQTKLSSVNSRVSRNTSPAVVKEKTREEELKTDVMISQSAPSVSTVEDWFKHAVTNVDDSDKQVDCLEHIMEKLEITLEDINQNTTNKFIHMFVGVQEQLNSMKEKLLELHQATAKSMLTDVVKMMDEKFAELHNRSQQEYMSFKEDMKQNAVQLIKEDCKKKRVMVKLLREDVNTVLENMRSKKKP